MIDEVHGDRFAVMLRTALGGAVLEALDDPLVVEIMVNPDGWLWVDRLGSGCCDTGVRLDEARIERIIRLVASRSWLEVHRDAPLVSAELRLGTATITGERFEGVLPPVTSGPCFAIRKVARALMRLEEYVEAGVLSDGDAGDLRGAVRDRRNILVAGGTSSGKTTLVNALLAELSDLDERVVVIEDTRELHCPAPDTVALKTKPGRVSMSDLVRSTLRLRPDRIIVGEIRGAEALDMLKAWNTGHPGGIATIHANSARSALYRIEQLVQEAVVTVPRHLIADAIDIIVFLAGRGLSRRVQALATVTGLGPDGDYLLSTPADPAVQGDR
jgi:P-type conjugative transfer ATPase TrbB